MLDFPKYAFVNHEDLDLKQELVLVSYFVNFSDKWFKESYDVYVEEFVIEKGLVSLDLKKRKRPFCNPFFWVFLI